MNERTFDLDRSVVGTGLSRVGGALLGVGAALWRIVCRRPLDSLGLVIATVATAAICINALFLQASPHPAPLLAGKPRPVAAVDATSSVVPVQPRPRPGMRETNAVESPATARPRAQIVSDIQRELSRRGFFDGPVDGIYGAKTDAAIRDFEHAAGVKPSAQPDEALLRAIARSPIASTPATPAASATLPAAGARPTGAARTGVAAKPAPPAPVPPAPIPTSKRVLAVQRALADFGYGQVRPSGVMGAETKAAIERFERERKLPVTGQISERLTRELAAVTGRPLD
jgi:peptidoglycan hydrolase-like protein with peptidoglycan-binding domain